MIKIYIQNYFMKNMFNKKNKTNNNKQMELHQYQKNKRNQMCIIIEKKMVLYLIKQKISQNQEKNKRLP